MSAAPSSAVDSTADRHGLFGGVPGDVRGRARDVAGLAVQLALVLLVVWAFRIEESVGFLELLPLIFVGFVVHAVAPTRFRRGIFLTLSLAAIWVIFRDWNAALLIGMGLGLIGVCHLPLPLRARAALLLGVGVLLAMLRVGAGTVSGAMARLRIDAIQVSGDVDAAVQGLVLPVLAAMFMFRLVVYLYDSRHDAEPAGWIERLSYFFLLPNICFPLFPVVDYRTYRRTYYDGEAREIYRKGITWMLRGVTHLLLYRLVYHHLLLSPSEVAGPLTLIQWMVATYGLYLRISGQFHMIVGILCLFGFNLPETHRRYWLAASFNDFWRRINIYWKDFMMKCFYYPTFTRLRGLGIRERLVVSTLVVFLCTWLLHSYQWFWLRGTFPITARDGLFWGILGVLVVANSLLEARPGGKRKSLAGDRWSVDRAFIRSARTVGVFLLIAVLWSVWSSTSVAEWWRIVRDVGRSPLAEWAPVVLLVLGAMVVGVGAQWIAQQQGSDGARSLKRILALESTAGPRRPWQIAGLAAVLLIAALPTVTSEAALGDVRLPVTITSDRLNERDLADADAGYYEGLLHNPAYTAQLWDRRAVPSDWVGVWDFEGAVRTNHVLDYELKPSNRATYRRAELITNRWGMRDREYEREKSPGTYRIALLGSSYTMGDGVENDDVYETVAEAHLNRELVGSAYDRFEILNFSVGGYGPIELLVVAQERIPAFDPDLVIYVAHDIEAMRITGTLGRLKQRGIEIPYPELAAVYDKGGVEPGMKRREVEERIRPHAEEALAWTYRAIVEEWESRGIVPIWLYLPTTREIDGLSREYPRLLEAARRAGFVARTLEDPYGGYDLRSIQVAPWDDHPGSLGHEILGRRLFELLSEMGDELGFAQGSTASGADVQIGAVGSATEDP